MNHKVQRLEQGVLLLLRRMMGCGWWRKPCLRSRWRIKFLSVSLVIFLLGAVSICVACCWFAWCEEVTRSIHIYSDQFQSGHALLMDTIRWDFKLGKKTFMDCNKKYHSFPTDIIITLNINITLMQQFPLTSMHGWTCYSNRSPSEVNLAWNCFHA